MPEVKKSGLIKTNNTNSVNETAKTPSDKKEEKKVTPPIATAAVKKTPKATPPEAEEEKKVTPPVATAAVKKAPVAKVTPPEVEDKPVKPIVVVKKIEEKKQAIKKELPTPTTIPKVMKGKKKPEEPAKVAAVVIAPIEDEDKMLTADDDEEPHPITKELE